MALSQASMGEEESALEKANEVAQQMRDAADREYAKVVAKRNELRNVLMQLRQLSAYRRDMTSMS
jgi:flagellar biosynthesis chaperone FliJ